MPCTCNKVFLFWPLSSFLSFPVRILKCLQETVFLKPSSSSSFWGMAFLQWEKKHGWMCSSWCLRRGQQGGHWGHSKTSSGDFVIALLDVLYPFFLRTFLENFMYLHRIYIFTPSLPFDFPHVLSTSWQLSWTLLFQLFLHTNTPVEFVECCFSVYTLLEPNTWYWITYQVTHPLRRLNLPLSAVINSL